MEAHERHRQVKEERRAERERRVKRQYADAVDAVPVCELLLATVRDWEEWVAEDYLRGTNQNSAVVLRAVTDVLAMRSERQQARLQRELAALERDLDKLMVPAGP